MNDIIDITDSAYGAHPQHTDNKEQIQKALDQGGKIYFPAGVYQVSGSLTVRSGSTLFGEGTLKLSASADAPILSMTGVQQVVLEGLSFDSGFAKKTKGTYASVFAANAAHIDMRKLHITNTANFGIEVEDSEHINIEHCHITRFGQRAINLVFCYHTRTVGNFIDGQLPNGKMGIHGIELWGQRGNDIRSAHHVSVDNTVKNVRGGGIWASWVEDITIMGNFVENCHDVCIDVEGTQHAIMSGNTVKNGKNGGISIFFASQYVSINSNHIVQEEGFGAGVRIFGKGISKNIEISRNTIQTDDSIGIRTEQRVLSDAEIFLNHIQTRKNIGIRMLDADRIQLLRNIVLTHTANQGIAIEGGSDCLIQANKVVAHARQTELPAERYPTTGGIYLYWRSEKFSCQRNRVIDNTVRGFQIAINDNCWGNSNSKNLIKNNTADNIFYNRQAGSYGGIIEDNHKSSESSGMARTVAY